jgi:hypothetical protein
VRNEKILELENKLLLGHSLHRAAVVAASSIAPSLQHLAPVPVKKMHIVSPPVVERLGANQHEQHDVVVEEVTAIHTASKAQAPKVKSASNDRIEKKSKAKKSKPKVRKVLIDVEDEGNDISKLVYRTPVAKQQASAKKPSRGSDSVRENVRKGDDVVGAALNTFSLSQQPVDGSVDLARDLGVRGNYDVALFDLMQSMEGFES